MTSAEEMITAMEKSQIFRHVPNFLARWRRWIPLAVFAAAAVTTLTFWKILPDKFRLNEQSDYPGYYEPLARSLIQGHGLNVNGEPATAYPPVYSLVLAGVFQLSHWFHVSDDFGLDALAISSMGLISILIFSIARTLWGELTAIISSFVWLTYPCALWLTKQPNTELPFMVVFYAGFVLFWHALLRERVLWYLYFGAGVLFGAAMLIRPIAIGIGFVFAVAILLIRRGTPMRLRLALMAALLLGNFITILPWEAYAYQKTGRIVMLGTVGVNGIRDGLTFAVDSKDYRKDFDVSPDVASVMNEINSRVREVLTLRDVVTVVSSEFQAHPVAMSKLYLLKITRSWYGTDSGRNEWLILLIQIPYLLLSVWGALTVWRRGGIDRGLVITVLLMVAYFWGMTVLALSILRYMGPVTGLLFLLVAGGVSPFKPTPLRWPRSEGNRI